LVGGKKSDSEIRKKKTTTGDVRGDLEKSTGSRRLTVQKTRKKNRNQEWNLSMCRKEGAFEKKAERKHLEEFRKKTQRLWSCQVGGLGKSHLSKKKKSGTGKERNLQRILCGLCRTSPWRDLKSGEKKKQKPERNQRLKNGKRGASTQTEKKRVVGKTRKTAQKRQTEGRQQKKKLTPDVQKGN